VNAKSSPSSRGFRSRDHDRARLYSITVKVSGSLWPVP
jgi:hypothetical protein